METKNIRNILFLGHQGSGKTSLVESLASIILKSPKGSVEHKNTISDYTDEEKARLSSCNLSVLTLDYQGYKINLFDAPGNDDFVFDVIGGLEMVEGAVLVVDATKKVEVGTIKHFNLLRKHNIPIIVYVNKMDKEHVKYDEVLEELSSKLHKDVLPFVYPIGHEEKFDGCINLVSLKAQKYVDSGYVDDVIFEDKLAKVEGMHNVIAEKVALTDEVILEKFFSGEALSLEELEQGSRIAILNNELIPVLVGSAKKDIGALYALETLIKYLPYPGEIKTYHALDKAKNKVDLKVDVDGPLSVYVFKTFFDQYKGAINVAKVISGKLSLGDTVYCPQRNETMKVTQMFALLGSKQTGVTEAIAGEIIALSKLDEVITTYTLTEKNNPIMLPPSKYPTSVYYRAINAKTTKDDEKLFGSLAKLKIEDPCLDLYRNSETKQLLIGGLSDSHLNYVLERVKNIFNIQVDVNPPKIQYRETVKKEATAPGRYVKQSGGSGFYGVVEMKFGPSGSEENVFEETVFGGTVPKNYHPAVEKGFIESTENGLLSGFRVIGMKAVLLDGKYHSVDSNELAFKMASIIAFKEAYMNCAPTLLEPIMKISVRVSTDFTGNIMNDLNQRRARILSID
ncbi:MAG: elongation factor G, partial [Erysipelotrichia bacterium]|nr:elongation factor G [Erysipelotrichia bacterium]